MYKTIFASFGVLLSVHIAYADNYTLINQNTNEVLLVCEQPPTLVGRGRYALSECTQEHKSETTNETPASENYLEGGPAVEADQGGLPSIKNYQPDTGFLRLQLVQSSYLERCKQADVCIPLLQPQDDNWPQPETGYFLALITDKDYGLRFRTDGKSPAGEQCVAIRETRPSNSVWNSDRNLLCTRYKNVKLAYTFALGHKDYENLPDDINQNNPHACFNNTLIPNKVDRGVDVWADNCLFLRETPQWRRAWK